MIRRHLWTVVLALTVSALPVGAQPAAPSTDFEWELQSPNRTLFRDRIPVGEVPLSGEKKSGFFGSRKQAGGEALAVIVEVAFIPGDTARFLAVGFELKSGESLLADVLLDAAEMPSFRKSVEYDLTTSENIANTERADTRVVYRSRAGMEFGFLQRIKDQRFEIHFPARDRQPAIVRSLNRESVLLFRDLLDLVLFELKRQGAPLPTSGGSPKP
jgi:hypothetical protein